MGTRTFLFLFFKIFFLNIEVSSINGDENCGYDGKFQSELANIEVSSINGDENWSVELKRECIG